MARTNWRARVGAWVGGYGVPGGFDATSGQRRLKGFTTSRAHVNALIAASGPEMNARARWLVRNNGYAANAIESLGGQHCRRWHQPELVHLAGVPQRCGAAALAGLDR